MLQARRDLRKIGEAQPLLNLRQCAKGENEGVVFAAGRQGGFAPDSVGHLKPP